MSDLPPFEPMDGDHEPVVRDKRRVTVDGSVREPDPSAEPAAPAGDPRVAELTDTLQRIKAEYDNYRKRVERDRQLVVDAAAAQVLTALLPVLDDVERARQHGDLTGAFGSVGEALVGATTKLGLERYGEAGEPFDPQVHDAVMQAAPVAGADGPVAAEVFRPGYRYAGRVLRPAQVAVAEPGPSDDPVGEGGDGPEPTPGG